MAWAIVVAIVWVALIILPLWIDARYLGGTQIGAVLIYLAIGLVYTFAPELRSLSLRRRPDDVGVLHHDH